MTRFLLNVDAPESDHFTVMPWDLDEVTNPNVAYLRLHGRNAKAYIAGKTVAARFDYDYNDEEIAEVAERSRKLARQAREVHAIFNNNNLDYAPRAALRLRKALDQIVSMHLRKRWSCSKQHISPTLERSWANSSRFHCPLPPD